jgi:hypothetical protein
MRFSLPLQVAAGLLLMLVGWGFADGQDQLSDAKKAAALQKRLVEEQKDVTRRLADWEDKLVFLQVKLERSAIPTQQQMAKHLKQVMEMCAKTAGPVRAKAMMEALTTSRFDNIGDLERLFSTADHVASQLGLIHEMVSDDFGPRMQRQAFEELHTALKAIAKEQHDLQRDNHANAILAADQGRLHKKTEQLAAALAANGKGAGRIGQHLQDAVAAIQEALKAQVQLQKTAENLKPAPDMLKFEASSKLYRTAHEIEHVVSFARVLEHQAALRISKSQLDKKLASLRRIDEDMAALAKAISRNGDKKPTRQDKLSCIRLSDLVKDTRKALENGLERPNVSEYARAIKDGLSTAALGLRTIERRLETSDAGPETSAMLKTTIEKLENGSMAIQEIRAFLATLEPGEFKEPVFKEVADSAQSLEKIIADQRRIGAEIRGEWLSRIGQPLRPLVDKNEKKLEPKK